MRLNSQYSPKQIFVTLLTFVICSASVAEAALPELEVNSHVRFTETSSNDSDVETGSDFRSALFFGKANDLYQYTIDFFESAKGLQGRFCQLNASGGLFGCFTLRENSHGKKQGCSISPYDTSRDVPKLKRGYDERMLNRSMDLIAVKSESARQQVRSTNLGRAGEASKVSFKKFDIDYVAGEKVNLGAKPSDLDFIRARGSVTCKRLFEKILPAYRDHVAALEAKSKRIPASSATPQPQS